MCQVIGSELGRPCLGGWMFWTCQVCACYIVSQVAISSMELDI